MLAGRNRSRSSGGQAQIGEVGDAAEIDNDAMPVCAAKQRVIKAGTSGAPSPPQRYRGCGNRQPPSCRSVRASKAGCELRRVAGSGGMADRLTVQPTAVIAVSQARPWRARPVPSRRKGSPSGWRARLRGAIHGAGVVQRQGACECLADTAVWAACGNRHLPPVSSPSTASTPSRLVPDIRPTKYRVALARVRDRYRRFG